MESTPEGTDLPEAETESRRSRREKRRALAVAKLRAAYYGFPYRIERR